MKELEFIGVEIHSGGETLRGDIMSPADDAPLVVLCHGIPLSVPDPSDEGYRGLSRSLAENGLAALFVNFRGCGDSTGNFYLGGWYEDICGVMDYALGELARPKTYMAGFSAGGALSIKYAAEHGRIDGLATFAAPSRLSKVFAREHAMQLIEAARDIGTIKDMDFPPSPDWFMDDVERNEAMDYVAEVSPVPILIVHGGEDEIVPFAQGKELFEAAREPKGFIALEGGLHRLRHDPRSIETLLAWIRGLQAR